MTSYFDFQDIWNYRLSSSWRVNCDLLPVKACQIQFVKNTSIFRRESLSAKYHAKNFSTNETIQIEKEDN